MKRFYIVNFVFMLFAFASGASAQSSSDIRNYIAKYSQIALDQERAYGVPASITIAQGILESGAGKSGLTRNANNHFGIKAFGGWKGPIYQAWDDEPNKSKFRVYATAAESFRDHSLFLRNNSRYRSLFQKSVYDYRGWAIGLQKAGYATAQTYAKALIGFIDAYQLYAINGGVKLRSGATVTIRRPVQTGGNKNKQQQQQGRPEFLPEEQMDENEESEEEKSVKEAVMKFLVEVNDVRCTVLYPGQTLSSVAMKYDIPKQKLLEFNETTRESDFKDGDIVFLEKKKSKYNGAQDFYRVKEGDSLYDISQQFGIKTASLAKMNDKNLFSALKEGEKLRLK